MKLFTELWFVLASGLDKHVSKQHLGIRPYICDKCGNSFGDETELRMHIARHAESKPHSCQFCSYSTYQKGSLKCESTFIVRFFTHRLLGPVTKRKCQGNFFVMFLLKERLAIDDIISVLQQNRLRWYVHVLQKENSDWVKNVWSMKWRVPDQEVDQRGCAKRLSNK